MQKLTFGSHYHFVRNHPQYRFLREEKTKWRRRYLSRYTKMHGSTGYPATNHCSGEIAGDVNRRFGTADLTVQTYFDLETWQEMKDRWDITPRGYVRICYSYISSWINAIRLEIHIGREVENIHLWPRNGMEINRENIIEIVRRYLAKRMYMENTKYRRGYLICGGDKDRLRKLLIRAWRPQKTIVPYDEICRCIRRKYNIESSSLAPETLVQWGEKHGRPKELKKLAEFRWDFVYDYLEGEEDMESMEAALRAYHDDMEEYILV